MFKLGVIIDSFHTDFANGLKCAAQLGVDGIQMYVVSGELDPDKLTADKVKVLKQAIRGHGLEVSAVCGDLGGHGFERREDNAWKIKKSKRIMEIARELGTRVVTTHIGVIPDDPACETYRIMQEACGELAAFAFDRGMYFATETGPETAPVLKGFIESVGGRGLAVNFDPANFVMVTGQDPVEAVPLLKDWIVHTHAKDGIMIKQGSAKTIYDFLADGGIGDMRLTDYFVETPLGHGDVDFDEYLSALKQAGYNGYLTIEREVGDNPMQDIEVALTLLREKTGQKRG